MRKIPTLFEREFVDHKVVSIKPIVTPVDRGGVISE